MGLKYKAINVVLSTEDKLKKKSYEPKIDRCVPDSQELLHITSDGKILPKDNRLEIEEANKLFKAKVRKTKPLDF